MQVMDNFSRTMSEGVETNNVHVTSTILSLTCGKADQCLLGLGFPSSIVFKLIEGSGPVQTLIYCEGW